MAKERNDTVPEEDKKGYCKNCKLNDSCIKAMHKYFGYCINSYVPKEEEIEEL